MKEYTLIEVLEELKEFKIDFYCEYTLVKDLTFADFEKTLKDDVHLYIIIKGECFIFLPRDWTFKKEEKEEGIRFTKIHSTKYDDSYITLSTKKATA